LGPFINYLAREGGRSEKFGKKWLRLAMVEGEIKNREAARTLKPVEKA
jgi:hypothetical protein